jgi:two-component system, chemotaxis family, chemotaxis protein CheY
MVKCLLVDDSEVVRKISRKIMEGFNFEIAEAANGKEALEQVKKQMPDFILLDWNMPIMDGMEFLQMFRQDKTSSNTKVMFCTTENDMSRITAAMQHGADEYVMKPFDKDIIKFKLQQLGIVESDDE